MNAPGRRFVVGGLILGSLAFSAGAISPAVAQSAALSWTPKALTPQQARTLDAVAEMIIPETDTPGARRAWVPAFIDRALAEFHTAADRQRIVGVLDHLGVDFAGLSTGQQTALLARLDSAGDAGFAALCNMVTIAYFTSEPGVTLALRYDPNPGEYRACVPLSEIGRAWATS